MAQWFNIQNFLNKIIVCGNIRYETIKNSFKVSSFTKCVLKYLEIVYVSLSIDA